MYNAYITKINNLRKHPNADRLQLGDCFGNTVCVDLKFKEGELGVYFPTDGQLSLEFAEANNLLRKKDEDGNNIGGYMDPEKRNVSAIRLRGEKSDGLFLPLTSLESFGDTDTLKEGDIINVFNGHEICKKYIPRRKNTKGNGGGNRTRKNRVNIAPLFAEHADTEQLAYNLNAFKNGDEIEITLKMHGTSARTGYLPILKGHKKNLIDKILRKSGKPIYEWGYVSGTRRTVLEKEEGDYESSNKFREQYNDYFEGKLWKGEEVFYEIVGFDTVGTPIMSTANNKKLKDKEFVKKYGDTTVFSYDCDPDGEDKPQSRIFVYRMTMTNEDGNIVEYTPDFMRYRCEQMGVNSVPVFYKGIIEKKDDTLSEGDIVRDLAEQYYEGPDPIGRTHIREGVVVRIINRPKFTAFKHKNFEFKVLENMIKVEAEAPDREEAEEYVEEG